MQMPSFRLALKTRTRSTLLRFGLDVHRTYRAASMESALRRVAARHQVRTVVDVGASDGRWTKIALKHFPTAAFLLIEAQAHPHEPALRQLKARNPSVDYVLAAAGDREGTIHFDASDPFGGVASETPAKSDGIVVPMTAVDVEVARRRQLVPPFLLKLDTHGFELPILEGAQHTVDRANLLVIETYNFELRPGSLRFHEMCGYLEDRGFACIDIADVLYRPKDGVLWQFDLFFAPKSHPVFRHASYHLSEP
jgi:FkbM family methyltransferase